jgi:hypothetical protein
MKSQHDAEEHILHEWKIGIYEHVSNNLRRAVYDHASH